MIILTLSYVRLRNPWKHLESKINGATTIATKHTYFMKLIRFTEVYTKY